MWTFEVSKKYDEDLFLESIEVIGCNGELQFLVCPKLTRAPDGCGIEKF